MTRSFRVGRVFGIDIEIDYTWFIIFALVVFGLSSTAGPLARALPDSTPLAYRLLLGVLTALLFFGSVLLHELSHSLVALHNGMQISGITLFIFGGVSKMTDEPRTPGIEFRMAIAGPGASFALALLFYFLGRLFGGSSLVLGSMCLWLAVINGFLGAFNLLPGFPLDGGRVLRAGLWHLSASLPEATRIAAAFGQGLGAIMIVLGLFIFFAAREGINGLWLAFIGWFLIQAAQSSYQQVIVKQTLSGVTVSDIMTREVDAVQADCTLEEVVHEHVLTHSHPAYPVFEDDHLLGLLSLSDIRHVPRAQRDHVTARQVVPPLAESQTISPGAEVWDALGKMATKDQGRLLVMEDGRMVGIVSRTDIMRVMRTRMELGT